MSTWPLLIFRSVGQMSVSKVKPILHMLGKGGISVLQTAIFKVWVVIQYQTWTVRSSKLGLLTLHWHHMPLGVGRGQNFGLKDFAIFWLCCRGHLCFTNTSCSNYSTNWFCVHIYYCSSYIKKGWCQNKKAWDRPKHKERSLLHCTHWDHLKVTVYPEYS